VTIKKPKKHHRIAATVGKNPAKRVRTELTGRKHDSHGQVIKKKKGGIIRRPKPPIKYPHKKTVT